ncbi:MAG: pyridoxamine 5'-phosphate oxidase family protein [Bacteroidales bacterium]|nr:pyridoxamine 5'-phosphate oxidase family protein [Bacteroidales bacterium]
MKPRILTNPQEVLDTADKCDVCFVSMVDTHGMPYMVPMNFGLKDGIIYLHSAQTGRKIDILKTNPNVCVGFTNDHKLRWQNEDVACSYSMKYRSIRAYGTVRFIENEQQKIDALNIIMHKYTGKEFGYNAPSIREVLCWCVDVNKWEGKVYGY